MPKSAGSRTLHKTAFRLHTWVGLHLCIALGLIFFSGTLLMFSAELTNIRQPSLWISPAVKTVSVGELYDTTRTTFPENAIDTIGSQQRTWFGRPFYLRDKAGPSIAHLNPYTGEIMGLQSRGKRSLRNLIRKLHDSLLVPINLVHVLVNGLSFAVLFLVITGLITYRRFWTGFFKKTPRDANRLVRESSRHRKFAVWVAPFLVISTLASSIFFLNAIGFKSQEGPAPVLENQRSQILPQNFDGTDLDTLVTACKTNVPGFKERTIKFPKSNTELIRINGYDSAVGEIFGAMSCHTNPDTLTVAGIVRASDGNLMTQIKALAIAIHFGTFAGWLSIVLWTVFGVASTYLAISGAKVYAARAIVKSRQTKQTLSGTGTLALLVQGLGIFKWLYLLWAIGAVVLVLFR